MKIVIPEISSREVLGAVTMFPDVEFVGADSLEQAVEMVKTGAADSMVSGLEYSSRDVLLAYRDQIPLKSQFFSSCFVCKRLEKNGDITNLILADGGVNKQPSKDQLYTIVEDTAATHLKYYNTTPKIAMLSYSTYGSGGKNPDLDKIHYVIDKIKNNHPDWLIDGEMQLDAAISPQVAAKKTPNSPLQGQANILITPDLNSGNILYKSLERFGGFIVAGPIIQGFEKPLADLSRGSTLEDVAFTIDVIIKLLEKEAQ